MKAPSRIIGILEALFDPETGEWNEIASQPTTSKEVSVLHASPLDLDEWDCAEALILANAFGRCKVRQIVAVLATSPTLTFRAIVKAVTMIRVAAQAVMVKIQTAQICASRRCVSTTRSRPGSERLTTAS
jgi:hypothetical protein